MRLGVGQMRSSAAVSAEAAIDWKLDHGDPPVNVELR